MFYFIKFANLTIKGNIEETIIYGQQIIENLSLNF